MQFAFTIDCMIKVLLTDDHHLFREGLSRILQDAPGMELIATAASGEEAQKLAAAHQPDIILMDVNMPGIGGIEATRQLHDTYPEIKVLMLTVSEEDQDLFTAIRAGAKGYILKNSSSQELLEMFFFWSIGYNTSGQREPKLPSAHRTVRTGPYTAPHVTLIH